MVALVSVDGDAKLNFIGCIFVLLYSMKNRVQSFDTRLHSTFNRQFFVIIHIAHDVQLREDGTCCFQYDAVGKIRTAVTFR